MREQLFTVKQVTAVAANTYEILLAGDTDGLDVPGRFVNIRLDGFYLRRPLSICDCSNGLLTLIFKAVGAGTKKLAMLPSGTQLNLLTGLGNGYDLSRAGEHPLLIGGGAGVPPMFLACKKLTDMGNKPIVILGFNSADEVFYVDRFRNLGVEVLITTADGSMGIRGFVTDALPGLDYTYYYTCGPEPMLKTVYQSAQGNGEFSFEERMGCGFGACVGCTCKTKYGNKRICRDGPVLIKEEIVW